MASLQITPPGGRPKLYQLRKQTTYIGTSEANDVSLPDPLIADVELQIVESAEGYRAITAEGGQDFLINGKPHRRHRLVHRDRLRIGTTDIVFLAPDKAATARSWPQRGVYEILLEFFKKVAGPYNLPQLLECFLDSAIALAAADTGFLILLADGEPRIHVARTSDREILASAAEQLSDSIVANVIATRATVFIEDVERDEGLATASSVVRLGLAAVLCVPLIIGDDLLGVLYVGKHSCGDGFGTAGREPVEVLAAQGALLVHNALLLNELRLDQQRLTELESLRYGALIGGCPAMQDVFRRIERIAALDAPVLITGERATGKELVAREIHQHSARSEGPFRILRSCPIGELSAQLEASQDGTLFVEDIEQLPLPLQDMLLRYLQGADGQAERTARVRLIASSEHDLAAEIAAGRLREELHTRLAALAVHLPALRERIGDLFLIARYLLDRVAKEVGSPARGFSREAIAAMKRYPWPGNIRELESRIRQAIVSAGDILLRPDDLGLPPSELPPIRLMQEARAEFEREYARQVIDLCNGNHTQAAHALGIARSTLYRYLGEPGEPDG